MNSPVSDHRQDVLTVVRYAVSHPRRNDESSAVDTGPTRAAAPGYQPAQRPKSTASVTSPTVVRCFPPRFQGTTSHCRPDDHVDVGLSDSPAPDLMRPPPPSV